MQYNRTPKYLPKIKSSKVQTLKQEVAKMRKKNKNIFSNSPRRICQTPHDKYVFSPLNEDKETPKFSKVPTPQTQAHHFSNPNLNRNPVLEDSATFSLKKTDAVLDST